MLAIHPNPTASGGDGKHASQVTVGDGSDRPDPEPRPIARAGDDADWIHQSGPSPRTQRPRKAGTRNLNNLNNAASTPATATSSKGRPREVDVVWPDPSPLTPWWTHIMRIPPSDAAPKDSR
jgi:hypothetical protein